MVRCEMTFAVQLPRTLVGRSPAAEAHSVARHGESDDEVGVGQHETFRVMATRGMIVEGRAGALMASVSGELTAVFSGAGRALQIAFLRFERRCGAGSIRRVDLIVPGWSARAATLGAA